ncbi:hypothetical protein AA0Z99_07100 [Agrococcus sp. 1P02AA]|uniref:hypothetical protein n=1 Tax=Agrococcus sp. 1P02AA TaxID=3132259 RepID=UPI0039A4C5C5
MTAIATAAVTSATPGTRIRMTARGRRALALLVAAPVLAAGALAGVGLVGDAISGAVASSSTEGVELEQISVMPGQSLWQIARSVAPEADPRDVIAEIELLNGIGGSIQPGELLAIPAHYSR